MAIKEKRRFEVFLETHEIIKVRFRRNDPATFFCWPCQTETPHLTLSEAVSIFHLTEIAVLGFVETNQAHSITNAAGSLLVCGNSLLLPERGSNGE
jgi:hypothetical protein